jgi:prepilin-type N-terminal cleavage/methylation domain-containing protein
MKNTKETIVRKKKHLRNLSSRRGYTFIELLVAISIMGIISTVGIASFVNYNDKQVMEGTASDVANFYILARQRAISQVKPDQCSTTDSLSGYRVVLNTSTSTYQLSVVCGASSYIVEQKKLPSNVTFVTTSPTTVFFNVPNANVDTQKTVSIYGYGKTKKVVIDPSGSISLK